MIMTTDMRINIINNPRNIVRHAAEEMATGVPAILINNKGFSVSCVTPLRKRLLGSPALLMNHIGNLVLVCHVAEEMATAVPGTLNK